MFNSVRRVDEVEFESNDGVLSSVDSRFIYEDRSSLSFLERIFDRIRFDDFFMVYIIGFTVLSGLIFSISINLIDSDFLFVSLFGFGGILFSIIFYVFLFFRGQEFSMGEFHPRYYIIGEDRVVVVPKSSGEVGEFIRIDDVDNIVFDEGFVEFSSGVVSIRFSLPDEEDFVEVQDEVYKIKN